MLTDESCRCGFAPIADYHTVSHPIVRNVGLGMTAKTTASGIEPTLSIFRHVPVPIPGRRTRERWPRIVFDGEPRPITCAKKVVLMGGRMLWTRRNIEDSFTWDAWWSISARHVWKCLISDTLFLCGAVDGGLTPSSDNQGDHPISSASSDSHDFRMGGRYFNGVNINPTTPSGQSGDPQLRNLDVERFFANRTHLPFIRLGNLSDSADPHYLSNVVGNPPNLAFSGPVSSLALTANRRDRTRRLPFLIAQ